MTFLLIYSMPIPLFSTLFFFNDPAPTEIYTLSLHDALPILTALAAKLAPSTSSVNGPLLFAMLGGVSWEMVGIVPGLGVDRKSTRLNSSHRCISYAVFCLKKKKKTNK